MGIPADGYTQGCFVFFLRIDPDPLCGYGFSAGLGPGLTRHTCGFTRATAYIGGMIFPWESRMSGTKTDTPVILFVLERPS